MQGIIRGHPESGAAWTSERFRAGEHPEPGQAFPSEHTGIRKHNLGALDLPAPLVTTVCTVPFGNSLLMGQDLMVLLSMRNWLVDTWLPLVCC